MPHIIMKLETIGKLYRRYTVHGTGVYCKRGIIPKKKVLKLNPKGPLTTFENFDCPFKYGDSSRLTRDSVKR
jgi:hypothetical protein